MSGRRFAPDIYKSNKHCFFFTVGNLVGMGLVPLQYQAGETAESLGLTGKEQYSIEIPSDLSTGQLLIVKVQCGMTSR